MAVDEAESGALRALLPEWPERVSSALARVEVFRAARPLIPEAFAAARRALAGVALLPVDDTVLDAARLVEPSEVRSLDAIHLASAATLGRRLGALVTYDRRMLAAAQAAGLPTLSPR